MRRVLAKDGTLFHYIGSPDSKESGRLYKGITSRLMEAGFGVVKKVPKAFGIIATGLISSSTSGGESVGGERFNLLRRSKKKNKYDVTTDDESEL